ncbi:hypothetical protein [Cupriavidus sp. BIS7]|uniref:hypothetical protein n=1 Tax=Cupriavidus sp. BIS7 TaxID=1217718 RepID=UPI0012F6267D|nr:hypothetical protein [Cupriavidus sp. BIS7]
MPTRRSSTIQAVVSNVSNWPNSEIHQAANAAHKMEPYGKVHAMNLLISTGGAHGLALVCLSA